MPQPPAWLDVLDTGQRHGAGALARSIDESPAGQSRSAKNQTKGNKSKIGLKLTTYNFDLYASAVKKFQEGQRVNLGMDKDGKLQNKQPEVLVIQGLDTDKI